MKAQTSSLYLASSSPRRKTLLQQLGVDFQTLPIDVDESIEAGEPPAIYVERMALKKAKAGKKKLSLDACVVLAADTIVVIEGKILGKPSDKAHAMAMLESLSGRSHEVMTSIALVGDDETCVRTNKTRVTFRPVSPIECEAYWLTGEPKDKAGAYGIQGKGAVFIEAISGSYSGVVGLPLMETAELLEHFKLPFWLDKVSMGEDVRPFRELGGEV